MSTMGLLTGPASAGPAGRTKSTPQAISRPTLFVPLVALLALAAWASLWWWDQGPYARYLRHGSWSEVAFLRDLCAAVPAVAPLAPGAVHAAAWVLMIAAMMLPTILPLLEAFRRLTAARGDRHALLGRVVLGYVAVWMLFGVAVHVLDAAVHALAAGVPSLAFNAWILGAGVLALSGLYQFSALKYRCLDQCRSPLGFVASAWHGVDARRESWQLGFRHGAFCVGCCWSLMLLMFAVGSGSIGWMLALAAIMAIEKNVSWGRTLARPLGAGLLVWASVIVAQNL
jgi:predicted metal-binding membrane protein